MPETALSFPNSDSEKTTPLRQANRRRVVRARPSVVVVPHDALPFARFSTLASLWEAEGEFKRLSRQTLTNRRYVLGRLKDFLTKRKVSGVGKAEIMAFIASANDGGREGRPAKATTVHSYFAVIRTFFAYCIKEGEISVSPCLTLTPPKVPKPFIRAFTENQKNALLNAAAKSTSPRRDVAILSLLLETGIRNAELLNLKRSDVHLGDSGEFNFLYIREGKGGKDRQVPFGMRARSALLRFIVEEKMEDTAPLFASYRGIEAGEKLTKSGLIQLLRRIGKVAGVSGVRISPHTCRHTMALDYVENGADAFTVQALLGHTSIKQTEVYVGVSQINLGKKVKKHSPLDNMQRK